MKADEKVPQSSKIEINKDIFDDLFAKSESLQKKEAKNKEKVKDIKEKLIESKVDLFSDNLFDDIDDIFTSNIVESKQKKDETAKNTLFDENDDLFADIAVTKSSITGEIKTNLDKSNTKSIFDSDDDLFTEKPVVKTENKKIIVAKPTDTKVNLKDSSLFDSDDDVDDIFSSKSKTDFKKKLDVINTEQINDNTLNKHEQRSETNQKTKPNDQKDILKENLDEEETNISETVTSETPTQSKPSGKIKPVISSNIVNDDNELFNSTSNNAFTKGDEKILEGTLSSLKDTDKVAIDNKLLKDGVKKTQNNVDDSLKDTTIFSNKNVVKKANDDVFSKDFLEDVEHNIDTKQYKNSAMDNSRPKPFKLEGTFSDMDDDGDIFSNDKAISQTKETSKINVESSSKRENILKHESENDLFKTSNLSTDIVKDVTTDKVKCTISQKTAPNTEPNIVKSEINKNTTENDIIFDEKGKPDNMKDVDSNKNLTVVDNIVSEENISHSDTRPVFETHKNTFDEIFNEPSKLEPDLFTDIFNDQPPIFQKPTEPKKSQNVNALFDDDSDDEALFFKKNDVILHDHPDDFSPDISGDRFDIFHDEPPAIDVVEDTSEIDEILPEQGSRIIFKNKIVEDHTTGLSENLFESRHHITIEGDNEKSKNDIDDLQSVFNDQIDILPAKLKTEKTRTETQVTLKTDELNTNVDKTDGVQNEPKKIGKLRPMNFNINVNTLLPGASPKKIQKTEQTDEQTISTMDNDELRINEVFEQDGPKLVKSVSFETEPDSKILDNKLSKDRVKIQVKRRPSTRRARREAVKKSGIDFGEDSTDNSSSIDDHAKESKNESEEQNDVIISEKIYIDVNKHNISQEPGEDALRNAVISKDLATTHDTDMSEDLKIEEKQFSKDTTLENVISSPTRDVKSKVVYILNDEDIFNSNPHVVTKMHGEVTKVDSVKVTEPVNITLDNSDIASRTDLNIVVKSKSEAIKTKQILNIVNDDDDDDIFKSMVTKSESKPNIQSETNNILGKELKSALNSDSDDDIFKDFTNVKKKDTTLKNEGIKTKLPKTEQKAVFDDLRDEDNELFNKNRKEFKASNNKTLFGSDSDEELFTGKKKDKQREVKEKKIEVKGSLFGDDDNDELFSSKDKKNTGKLIFFKVQ